MNSKKYSRGGRKDQTHSSELRPKAGVFLGLQAGRARERLKSSWVLLNLVLQPFRPPWSRLYKPSPGPVRSTYARCDRAYGVFTAGAGVWRGQRERREIIRLEPCCVIAGTVVLRATNVVHTDGDETAHAEARLASLACRELSRAERAASTMYASTEPCAMCAGGNLLERLYAALFMRRRAMS